MESKGRSRKGETVEVSLIFKIAAVGILVSILCQILKHSGREEQAFLVSLAGLLMVLFWIVPYIYELFESIDRKSTRLNSSHVRTSRMPSSA